MLKDFRFVENHSRYGPSRTDWNLFFLNYVTILIRWSSRTFYPQSELPHNGNHVRNIQFVDPLPSNAARLAYNAAIAASQWRQPPITAC